MNTLAALTSGEPRGQITGLAQRRDIAWMLILSGVFSYLWLQAGNVPSVFQLELPDSDDVTRLLGVRDFLSGQGWFDVTQYRYLPPDGVPMHWSRLVDLPLAAGIAALTPLLGVEWAERIVVALWPLLLFLAYAGLVGWGMWRHFGPLAGGMAVLLAGQMIVFNDLFAAGRIDHHNIQIILIAGAAIAFGLSGPARPAAAAGGALCGVSLAIGLETLPFVACIASAYAVLWIGEGASASRSFVHFGAGLAVSAVCAFLGQTAPALWMKPVCDAISAPSLLLTSGGGLAALALASAAPRLATWRLRLAGAAAAAIALLAITVIAFPACLDGPYQVVPEPYRSNLLHGILEAQPLHRFFRMNTNAALQAMVPVILGAVAATIGACRSRGENRRLLALLAGLLWLGAALAQFQIRTVYMTSAFVPLAGGWYLAGLFGARQQALRNPARILAVTGGVLMFGIPWAATVWVLAPHVRPPVKSTAASACNGPQSVAALNQLEPGRVLTQIDLGPPVLLHTGHSIVSVGYHRAPAGIIAAATAFTGSEGEVEGVVREFAVDYLVICPDWLARDPTRETAFAGRLAKQGASASWLKPLDLPDTPLKVWRVLEDSKR